MSREIWQVELMPRHSYYLGPTQPRIPLGSWKEVVSAAGSGALDETQWVELKEAVPPSNKPANLELARDLASLSVDGGLLIIGIEDANRSAGDVVGTNLEGIETRIVQVAHSRIRPPLPVSTDVVGKPDDPEVGVVLISVPASAAAPHMVDDRYWGRSAEGKRALSDAEVRRLLADQAERSQGFEERLRAIKNRLDPESPSRYGRLYMVVEPMTPSRESLVDLLEGKHVLELVVSSLGFRPQLYPSFEVLNHGSPHPQGRIAASLRPGDIANSGKNHLAVLLGDDGTVSVSAPAVQSYGSGNDGPPIVSPAQVLETVHSAAALTGFIASQFTGYHGAFKVGLHLTGLKGLLPSQAHSKFGSMRFSPYPEEEYLQVDQTTTEELTERIPHLVERLTRRLLRAMSVAERFLPYEDPQEISRRA